jgi:oligopeptide transport system ATP-binding protein
MKPLLEVKNLRVNFKMKHKLLAAVRGVDFSLFPGETVGIVGESGCGKSVTAKSIVRILPEDRCTIEGEVLCDGNDLLNLSERGMQKIRGKEIGMIFQDPMTSLNPTMKIGDQIIEGYLHHHPEVSLKEARAYALELLKLVQIPRPLERIDTYPHSLSGGMRQRVMIALALAAKPKLLIADEPTTALDVTIQAQILELMKQIQKKMGMTILIITHDLSVLAGFCDRVLVMYAGKIVESAPVEQLFESPSHPYTRRLLQAIPRLDLPSDRPLHPIEGKPPELHMMPPGCAFCERCTETVEKCDKEIPHLLSIAPNHKAACWRYVEANR